MIDQMKQQLTNLALQRATLKDQLETVERSMQQLGFAVQALEADAKSRAEATKDADEPQPTPDTE